MDTETLKSPENWSHFWPSILKAGRCTHAEPEGMDEEEKAAYMEKLAEDFELSNELQNTLTEIVNKKHIEDR